MWVEWICRQRSRLLGVNPSAPTFKQLLSYFSLGWCYIISNLNENIKNYIGIKNFFSLQSSFLHRLVLGPPRWRNSDTRWAIALITGTSPSCGSFSCPCRHVPSKTQHKLQKQPILSLNLTSLRQIELLRAVKETKIILILLELPTRPVSQRQPARILFLN